MNQWVKYRSFMNGCQERKWQQIFSTQIITTDTFFVWFWVFHRLLYLGADRLITKLFLYRGGLERGQGQYYAQKFIYPQTLLLLLNSGDVYQQNTITSKTPYLPTASILNINNRIFCSFSILDPRQNHKILEFCIQE